MNHELTQNKLIKSDEYYTLDYAIYPIVKYLPKGAVIWCPFDTDKSRFVILLRQKGYEVVNSHIWNNKDFFIYKPDHFDIVLSNPPYSKRTEILKRLYSFKKPFALLINESGLFNSKERFNLFKNNPFEIMYFDKRVHYEKDGKVQKQEPFNSIYLCSQLLSQKIVFENLSEFSNGQSSLFNLDQ